MTTLTPDAADELGELRRRAYGPGGGSALDSAEIQRLHELERLAKAGEQAAPPAVASPVERDEPAAVAVPTASPAADPAPEPSPPETSVDDDPPDGTAPVPSPPWWRRRSVWIAAGAGLVIGVASTWGGGMLRAVAPTEVLRPTDKQMENFAIAAMPSSRSIEVDSLQHYGPWSALDIWTFRRTDGSTCLMFSPREHDEGSGYFSDLRCAARGLDPQYDLWFWPGMDQYTGIELPAESNVRFVARSGVVDVWVQPAGSPSGE